MVNLIAAPMKADAPGPEMPHAVRTVADLRIPVAEGRTLSARLWLPADADQHPVPAVIEYAPFRHRDFTYPRDQVIHPWFAGHGYASIRLEPAGSQESGGTPMDEYVAQEQDDAVAALAWIAGQGWCSGATGMFGMSWGAFSALQVAARRPPSLKAIIPVHGTDDRFNDDIHYKGGALLCAGLTWGALYQTYMMRPPDPETAGPDWRDTWLERMEHAPDILPQWIGHHSRDAYWRHGSVREDFSQIEAATYVMCGWTDGYTNAAVRLFNGLTSPRKLLIGPWGHTYPHIALPGPQIGFLREATRWWDRWLKGIENGIDNEPKLRIYMQTPAPPKPSHDHRDGRWIASDSWPLDNTVTQRLHLLDGRLAPSAGPTASLQIKTPLSNSIGGFEWLPHGVGPELPLDQRQEDAGSLVFDSAHLDQTIELCGTPVLHLDIASDQPEGTLYVRLCDVWPDGQVSLISYGLLDLAHRDSMAVREPLTPGETVRVRLALDVIAQSVPQGHRLRLSIATETWPLTWPTAQAATFTLETRDSFIDLPLRDPQSPDGDPPDFEPPQLPGPPGITWVRPVSRERTICRDVVTGETSRTYVKDDGCYTVTEHGMSIDCKSTIHYAATGEDPLSATGTFDYDIKMARQGWQVHLETRIRISATAEHFQITGFYRALETGDEVYRRDVDQRIPRG